MYPMSYALTADVMARSYGTWQADAWRDAEFRKLTGSQQRTYMMLTSQGNMTAVGVIAITPTRWAGLAADTTVESINDDLRALTERRFTVVDHDTDELLVRTLVKWDKAYNNPKRIPSIIDAFHSVMSGYLRNVIRNELSKLGFELPGVKGQADSLFDDYANDIQDGSAMPSGMSSGMALPSRGRAHLRDRDLDRDLDRDHITSSAHDGSDHDLDFVAFWAAYPRKVSKGHARTAWVRAVKRAEPSRIIAAAASFAADPGRRERGSRLTPHPATWLNGERWTDEDENLAPTAEHRASTTDARVRAGLELVERFEREELESEQQQAIGGQ